MSRKSSQKRIEANRRNAQKSTGPRTPEGKAKSAANSTKHGLSNLHINPLSPRTLLGMEDETHFRLLYGQYVDDYRPQRQEEYDLLTEAVYAKWRQRRLWIAESAHLEVAIALHSDDLLRQLPNADKPAHLANGVAKSEGMLKLYLRYDAQLRRHYRQCLQDLRDLQENHPPADSPLDPPAPPPEPEPEPASPPAEPEPAPQSPTVPNTSTPNEPNLTPEPARLAHRNAEIQRFPEPSRARSAQRQGEIA